MKIELKPRSGDCGKSTDPARMNARFRGDRSVDGSAHLEEEPLHAPGHKISPTRVRMEARHRAAPAKSKSKAKAKTMGKRKNILDSAATWRSIL